MDDVLKDISLGIVVSECETFCISATDFMRNSIPVVGPIHGPIPEISPDDAKEAGAFIVWTGSSQYPNQINNVLVFPGLFRGAIDANARTINTEMMVAASEGIASCVSKDELSTDYILPYPYDRKAHVCVAQSVKEAAIKTGVIKKL